MRLIILVTGIFLSFNSNADWASFKAGYACNQNNGYFEIYSIVETSTPDEGEIYPDSTIKVDRNLFEDGDNTISCVFNKYKIDTKLTVYPPRASGEGAGSERLRLNYLKINKDIIFENTVFNSEFLFRTSSLVSIKIKNTKTGLSINYCTVANWGWGVGYKGKKCINTTLKKMLTRHSS
ncbi:MAG: hypothetical protein OQK75_00815 [Gammaproteobacteria bacterium]|nr:hypothetical protein [Gammaproteobacteria bacterium]